MPEPEWTPMYAKRENADDMRSAVTGNPFGSVFLKIDGALPEMARPSVGRSGRAIGQREGLYFETSHSHSARELVYKSLEAADQAEVRRHALIIYCLFSPNL